jgi:hypothetical protein
LTLFPWVLISSGKFGFKAKSGERLSQSAKEEKTKDKEPKEKGDKIEKHRKDSKSQGKDWKGKFAMKCTFNVVSELRLIVLLLFSVYLNSLSCSVCVKVSSRF